MTEPSMWPIEPKYRVLFVVVMAFILFAIGMRVGALVTNAELPDCQEDEYLYPRDFMGAGNNVTSDYECHHFEEMTNG